MEPAKVALSNLQEENFPGTIFTSLIAPPDTHTHITYFFLLLEIDSYVAQVSPELDA